MQVLAFVLAFVAPLIFAQETNSNTPIVQTSSGPVIGLIDPATSVHIFKNIPYGADTAPTRWKAPVSPSPWTEPKLCTEYGNIAPQPWGQDIAGMVQSEDCLNLNVWTPALDHGKRRPVLVYFHGGGYESGTSNDPAYDGVYLASKRGVVVVTVSHRLNGFGYLYVGGLEDRDPGDYANAGQMDLILALKWVRDNISKFGGDKHSVTIFGQSGGGAKCATLMAMPAAKGLFHRVWTMSGQQITGRTKEHAKDTAGSFFAQLLPGNVGGPELMNASMDEVRKAIKDANLRYKNQEWAPAVDGHTLPVDPFYPTANLQSEDIPMVMGNTYSETRNLIGSSRPALFNLTWKAVPKALEQNIPNFMGNLSSEEVVKQYRNHYPEYSPSDVFFAATTAARSWKSMLVQAEIRASQVNSPLWTYYLRWKSPLDGGKWGAQHTLDIPFVFMNINSSKHTKAAQGAEELAEVMSSHLVQFARTGDPDIPSTKHGPVLNTWPRYQLKDRKSMIFDLPLEIHSDDRGWEREFWRHVPYVQPGT